jgi:hypothetical protein
MRKREENVALSEGTLTVRGGEFSTPKATVDAVADTNRTSAATRTGAADRNTVAENILA